MNARRFNGAVGRDRAELVERLARGGERGSEQRDAGGDEQRAEVDRVVVEPRRYSHRSE
jgi:hypothetical protein